jgi:hypothetical protein
MRHLPAIAVLALSAALAGCGSVRSGAAPGQPAAPPDGTRWVGSGRVVVAVPEWWSTGETVCLAPVEDTVYVDQSATADCADGPTDAEVARVSALAVLDGGRGYGELQIGRMRPAGTVAGLEVLELDGCEEWFAGVCRRLFAVPSEDAVFAVTIADSGDGSYQEIRDSLRVLPAHLTTVPLATVDGWTPAWGAEPRVVDSLRDALEAAGLGVEVVTAEPPAGGDVTGLAADLPAGSLLGVSPELGSVVDVGGTVTITVAGAARG